MDLVDYIFGSLHFHEVSVLHGYSNRVGEKVVLALESRERGLTHDADHDRPVDT